MKKNNKMTQSQNGLKKNSESGKKTYTAPAILGAETLEAAAIACPPVSNGGFGKDVDLSAPSTHCTTLGS